MSEPPIDLRAAHDSGAGNVPPTRIVIHATCPNVGYPRASQAGTALGTARYFQNPNAGGSAHYVCDISDEQHCVPDNVVAWHAPPNMHSIGVEICSEGGAYALSYTRSQWLSDPVWPAVRRAAARTRELCLRFGLPMVKLSPADLIASKPGICGHVDVTNAFHQSTHSDPGPEFPWAEFMAAVNQQQGENVSASDVWNTPIDNPYTATAGDTMPAAAALGWAQARSAQAMDRATEARDAARAVGLAVGQMRGDIADMKAQLAAVVAMLTKPTAARPDDPQSE